MGYDRKYGNVTFERGNIGRHEPVVVFRAKDVLLKDLLRAYIGICMEHGVKSEHLKTVIDTCDAMIEWQRIHGAKIPDTEFGQAIDQTAIDMTLED